MYIILYNYIKRMFVEAMEEISCRVVATALNCEIVLRKFELHLRYCIYFGQILHKNIIIHLSNP